MGESNRLLSLLTPELGILRATAFGALKSKGKLHGYTSHLAYGSGDLYHDPVKGFWKLSSVDGGETFVNIGTNLKAYFAGCVMAEIYPHLFWNETDGPYFFDLMKQSLYCLNDCSEKDVDYILIQYLWRLLVVLGFAPDFEHCCKTGVPLDGETSIYYQKSYNGFTSAELSDSRHLMIHRGVIKYLKYTYDLSLEKSLKVTLSDQDISTLKSILIAHIQNEINYSLKTIKMSSGIL